MRMDDCGSEKTIHYEEEGTQDGAWRTAMSDAERTKNYFIYKLRKNYQEGKLDTSQVARLKAIGFDFDGAVFNASKDSLAVQYPAIAEEWDKE